MFVDVTNITLFSLLSFFKAPDSFTFVDAVDLLYKIHKVFELPFSPQIKHSMDFLDSFVYRNEFDDDLITPTMRKVAKELLKVPI